MKTIGQQIKWDFETNGSLEILDKDSNLIYYENSKGDWVKREWDSQVRQIYIETSGGYWEKQEWDSQGNRIYYEDSDGRKIIEDYRPKSCEGKEIVIEGEKYKLVKV